MKTKFSTEDLIHSLPDYVTNRISDTTLKAEIEFAIENNPSFKLEYDELKNTLGFLNSYALESPSNSYFNNLSVKINDRIISERTTESFWERLGLAWKILIPFLPVAILVIVLLSNFQKEKIISIVPEYENNKTEISNGKNTASDKEITKTETGMKPNLEKTTSEEFKQNKNSVLKSKKFNRKIKNNQSSDKNLINNPDKNMIEEKDKPKGEEEAFSNILLSDNIELLEEEASEGDEDVLYSGDNTEEETLEEEFINLTPEEQQEIIDNLNKTQI